MNPASPPGVFWGQTFTGTATLTDTVTGGTGVSTDTITFSGTGTSGPATGTTGATGATPSTTVTASGKGTVGTQNVNAAFAGDANYVASSSDTPITILAHTTTVFPNTIQNQFAGNQFTISGTLTDTVLNTGVTGESITVTGTDTTLNTPITISSPVLTNSVEFQDSQGLTVTSNPPNNYISLHPGTSKIDTLSIPQFVVLYVTNMGTDTFQVSVTDGGTTPSTQTFTGQGQGADIGIFTITMPNGISRIQIVSESGGPTVNISRIQTIDSLLTVINDDTFTPGSFGNTLFFNQGTFNTIGTAPVTSPDAVNVVASFGGDNNYQASAPPATQDFN